MKRSHCLKQLLALTMLLLCQPLWAQIKSHPWYVAAGASIFQGNYDLIYNDQIDDIPQNIRQTLQQYGYNGAIAFGYSKTFLNDYFAGAEVSAQYATYKANFDSGSVGTAFSDQIKIQSYYDLVFVPGFFITDTVAAYIKAGVSYAYIKDSLHTPTSSIPTYVTINNNSYLWGVALGIGLEKFITEQLALFSEFQYHDYGTVNFPAFPNFASTYSHSAHVYSEALMLGARYAF